MLQNHYKGAEFSPNNQKKTQKKHKIMQNLTCPKAFYAFFITIILELQPISHFYDRASLGHCQ